MEFSYFSIDRNICHQSNVIDNQLKRGFNLEDLQEMKKRKKKKENCVLPVHTGPFFNAIILTRFNRFIYTHMSAALAFTHM